jgi:hypothetical protein
MKEEPHFINEKKEDAPDSDQETLQIIREKTAEELAGLSEYHGLEHTTLVAHYAKLLALGENKDPLNAEMSGWTHDWGRTQEKTDEQKRPHAKLSGEVSKDFYRSLWEKGKITAAQYGDIQRAIRHHSSAKKTQRDALKITRDADRLSRFGSLGLYHNVTGLVEEGKPFYIAGQQVRRSPDAPPLTRKEGLSSVTNALNFVLEWEHMLETNSAKKLIDAFDPTYIAFLDLVSKHTDLNEGNFWIDLLKKSASEFQAKTEEFEKSFSWSKTKEDFDKWLEFYKKVEGPEIFSEQKLQEFILNKNHEN